MDNVNEFGTPLDQTEFPITVGRMTKGCLSVLKRALQDIIELPQPDGHDCDDDEVIELLADLIEKEEEKEE